MSKLIKGMEIEALRKDFNNVKNFVFLEVQGITAQNNTGLRATLRKKKIHFKVVKNTLARKVLSEQGIGDVIFYSGMLNDLQPLVDKMTVCIDSRLVPLYQRSFKQIEFISTVSSRK